MVDRIVAIVGDTAVTQSELQEFIFRLQSQGAPIPEDPDSLRGFLREALDQKVNEVLLVIHAQQEGIRISDTEVEDAVDQRLGMIRRQFQTPLEFEQALRNQGMTTAEFRIQLGEQIRSELVARRYLQQKISEMQPIPISEEEVRQRFEQDRRALGPKPPTVTLKQIMIPPRPSDAAKLLSMEKIEQALSRARAGEDFARLAREYSEDPVSREKGGELGWVRKGQLLPQFEEKLFSMRVGEISDIVETVVGFHIIKLDRVRGGDRFARHILVRPVISEEDIDRAQQLADSAIAALQNGADADSLIHLYGDPSEQNVLTNYPQDQLPPQYQEAIAQAGAGDVIGPFQVAAPGVPGGGYWIAGVLVDLSPGGEWSLDDVREPMRASLQQEKMLKKVVDDLRQATFIEVRDLEALPVVR
jgi:peptidyl-prolyl cis-trans isomerase SurA